MGKWIHRLSNIDKENRYADCSGCNGRVYLKKGGASWRCKNAFNARRRGTAFASSPKDGSCEICHKQKLLNYDHSHLTGEFRGWLCTSCNLMLGLAKDDPDVLVNGANYLRS